MPTEPAPTDPDTLVRAVEEAALNAWPALRVRLYDGWLLRFADGHSKRANSVNPIHESALPIEAKIAACERAYAARRQPCIFRLTPLARPAGLDEVLAGRGYARRDPTLVSARDLGRGDFRVAPDVIIDETADQGWLDAFAGLSGLAAGERPTLAAMLARIPGVAEFASLSIEGRVAACVLGVREEGMIGIFEVVTDPAQRRRGLARKTIETVLARAAARGATSTYVQVVAANAPARALYDGLGYRPLYRYHYRIKPAMA